MAEIVKDFAKAKDVDILGDSINRCANNVGAVKSKVNTHVAGLNDLHTEVEHLKGKMLEHLLVVASSTGSACRPRWLQVGVGRCEDTAARGSSTAKRFLSCRSMSTRASQRSVPTMRDGSVPCSCRTFSTPAPTARRASLTS